MIGTIGQTQGITSANRPPIAEAIRNGNQALLGLLGDLALNGRSSMDGPRRRRLLGATARSALAARCALRSASSASTSLGRLAVRAEPAAAAPWALAHRRAGPSVRRREASTGRGCCKSSRRRPCSRPGSGATSCPAAVPVGNLELDAPGDLVLVVLHELEVGEVRVLVLFRLLGGGPVALDLEAGGIEEVERVLTGPGPCLPWSICICDSRDRAWRSP